MKGFSLFIRLIITQLMKPSNVQGAFEKGAFFPFYHSKQISTLWREFPNLI
jgi:hypothetical protein